jgi:hypothetical protein
LANNIANDIQDSWNNAKGIVSVNGIDYDVKFVITGEYKPYLKEKDIISNTDIKQNFIRIEEETDLSS